MRDRKILVGIIILLFSMSLVTIKSETILAGECLNVSLGKLNSTENIVYDIVGNSSDTNGLNISLIGKGAIICTDVNYRSDNFTIIFIDNSTNTIIEEVPETIYKDKWHPGGVIYKNDTIYVNNETKVTDTSVPEDKNAWLSTPLIIVSTISVILLMVLSSIIIFKIKKSKKLKVDGEHPIVET